MDLNKWTLKGYVPRPEQVTIIDEITSAIDSDYTNIILEAGTGIGKSAIATTISNTVDESYILTMTNQLQSQYLSDFKSILMDIKGRSNYPCNYQGDCSVCVMEEENEKKCYDCSYLKALRQAQKHPKVLTNYDYLWYSGNYAGQWDTRDLLILDESHNFEKKIMNLVSENLNRKTIYNKYGFDIFYPVANGENLKVIQGNTYWIRVLEKLIEKIGLKEPDSVAEAKKNTYLMEKYKELINYLKNDDWIIDLPRKQDILNDDSYKTFERVKGLKVEFKPLMINDYSHKLLDFGDIRLFLTGTLGNKQRFCHWNGIDLDSTYYIYQKSPFPIRNRPIIKNYVGNLSGFTNKVPNWKNNVALKQIKRLIQKHSTEKGVIHTSSNAQAWWIKKNLNSKLLWVAQGKSRENTISSFEKSKRPVVLIGAGLKDGVDFKGDKCRYQIIFKMPKPSIADTQTIVRARKDSVWYAYQTIMSLMQSYGRGIRDMDDYCTTYILDSDFENFLKNNSDLFNEYFLEGIV